MIDEYFRNPALISLLRTNALAREIEALMSHLHERGHPATTVQRYALVTEHFGRWLAAENPTASSLDGQSVHRFLQEHLPHCRCRPPAPRHVPSARAALRHLLTVTGKDMGRPEHHPTGSSAATAILVDFKAYLESTCGLAPATRHYCYRYAREFLEEKFGLRPPAFERLKPRDIVAFVADYAQRTSRDTAAVAAFALRSFFRFLHVKGLCKQTLANAVPRIARVRLSSLPTTMSEQQVHEFLAAFDRTTADGKRDFAMALCMVELGLRANEVATLCLADLDWRQSVLTVSAGKRRRSHQLPIPSGIGQAIAAYLREGRPETLCRAVFVGHRVPVGLPLSTEQVRGAMRRAYGRMTSCPKWTGTHVLRHTAATRMHVGGASLKQIADVLGHRSIDSAAIYAKVDLPLLKSVALSWPKEDV